MKVLTYTLYKEHYDLYTKFHGSIAVNSCQIELTHIEIILLSEASIIIYKVGKRTSVENTSFIHFNLSVGTYSIHHFSAKIKVVILQQRQDWEPPQIKDLKLVIPEDLIHHRLQYHCHCTANKSIKSKTIWINNHQVC